MPQPFGLIDIAGYGWLLADAQVTTALLLLLWTGRGLVPKSSQRRDMALALVMAGHTVFEVLWLSWRRGGASPEMAGLAFLVTALVSVCGGFVYVLLAKAHRVSAIRGSPS